jgi:hydrogenase maturation protease
VTPRVLIAGIGNIFFSDDGFGVEVVRRMAGVELPGWVKVADYGIRGMHLAYDLAAGVQTAVLVDAARRGGTPGTLYVIEPERGTEGSTVGWQPDGGAPLDAHGMRPDAVLRALDLLGAKIGRILIVGCEPASTDEGIGLSAPVAAAVDHAIGLVLELAGAEGRQPPGECLPQAEGLSDVSWHTR